MRIKSPSIAQRRVYSLIGGRSRRGTVSLTSITNKEKKRKAEREAKGKRQKRQKKLADDARGEEINSSARRDQGSTQ